MKQATSKKTETDVFTSWEELEEFCEQEQRAQRKSISIALGETERLSFEEQCFTVARACHVAEISAAVLISWLQAGFRQSYPWNKIPRATDVAKLCAVREMVSVDIPLSSAFEIAEKTASMVLYYALRSSSSLTTVRRQDGLEFRQTPTDIGSNERYLAHFLGAPIAPFAVIADGRAIRFIETPDSEDHVEGVVLGLEATALRMAERSGVLASMVIRDTADHGLIAMGAV